MQQIPDWTPKIDAYEPSLVQAAKAAGRFVADIAAGKPARWVTFSGPCGTGKTMLARQIFAEAARLLPSTGFYWGHRWQGDCKLYEVADFLSQMRRDIGRSETDIPDLPERLANSPFVALDDLGASRDPSGFVADAILRLCNKRAGKWTVFTSNLTLEEISTRIDGRVASRLIRDGNQVFQITARDYALTKRRPFTV